MAIDLGESSCNIWWLSYYVKVVFPYPNTFVFSNFEIQTHEANSMFKLFVFDYGSAKSYVATFMKSLEKGCGSCVAVVVIAGRVCGVERDDNFSFIIIFFCYLFDECFIYFFNILIKIC